MSSPRALLIRACLLHEYPCTQVGIEALMAATGGKVLQLREEARAEYDAQEHFDQVWEHKRQERRARYEITQLSEGVFPRERQADRAHGHPDRLGKR